MSNKFWNDRTADPVRWHWVLAIVIGVLVGIYAPSCGQDNHPEAAEHPAFTVASGKLSVTRTLDQFRYWHVGGVTVVIEPNQVPADLRLRELDGRIVELVVREIK